MTDARRANSALAASCCVQSGSLPAVSWRTAAAVGEFLRDRGRGVTACHAWVSGPLPCNGSYGFVAGTGADGQAAKRFSVTSGSLQGGCCNRWSEHCPQAPGTIPIPVGSARSDARSDQQHGGGGKSGFSKSLEIAASDIESTCRTTFLSLSLGYSHPVDFTLPSGITASIEKTECYQAGRY